MDFAVLCFAVAGDRQLAARGAQAAASIGSKSWIDARPAS